MKYLPSFFEVKDGLMRPWQSALLPLAFFDAPQVTKEASRYTIGWLEDASPDPRSSNRNSGATIIDTSLAGSKLSA